MSIGGFSWSYAGRRIFADLHQLSEYDENIYKVVGLKEGEKLFRYSNDKTQLVGILPIVKINVDKKLIYFVTERGAELDIADFETRGIKLHYLTIKE